MSFGLKITMIQIYFKSISYESLFSDKNVNPLTSKIVLLTIMSQNWLLSLGLLSFEAELAKYCDFQT